MQTEGNRLFIPTFGTSEEKSCYSREYGKHVFNLVHSPNLMINKGKPSSSKPASEIQFNNIFSIDPTPITRQSKSRSSTIPMATPAHPPPAPAVPQSTIDTQNNESRSGKEIALEFDPDDFIVHSGSSIVDSMNSFPLSPWSPSIDIDERDVDKPRVDGDLNSMQTPPSTESMSTEGRYSSGTGCEQILKAQDVNSTGGRPSRSGSGFLARSPYNFELDLRSSRSPSPYSNNIKALPQLDNPLSLPMSRSRLGRNSNQVARCRCLESGSVNLEEWETRRHENRPSWIDSLLALQKKTINQCNVALDCKNCSAVSSSMMLPLLMCEEVVSSFQLISESGVSLIRRSQEGYLRLDENGSAGSKELKVSHRFFGAYEIESPKEWQHIVWALVAYQLKQLYSLLGRINSRASSAGWSAHFTKAVFLQEKVREMMTHCQHESLNSENGDWMA